MLERRIHWSEAAESSRTRAEPVTADQLELRDQVGSNVGVVPPQGFVRENPTAPIQLACRRAPPCLNDFCRLGCVCPSLTHGSRTSHCGRPACMLGCSCLKQKVVLLKNLDGSDSSPSHHRRRRKRRRMKMAYGGRGRPSQRSASVLAWSEVTRFCVVAVLKEADSVSQPAERVRTLWTRDGAGPDPEPVHVPKRQAVGSWAGPGRRLPPVLTRPLNSQLKRTEHSSCARVRGYRGNERSRPTQASRAGANLDPSRSLLQEAPEGLRSKQTQPKSRGQGNTRPDTRTRTSAAPPGQSPFVETRVCDQDMTLLTPSLQGSRSSPSSRTSGPVPQQNRPRSRCRSPQRG